ncbi:unnamed protein product [Pieris macdunnoughi]|uniref:Uncharacterized protein n=1 Tax=Pieris macdunnoughi TaxID=345717 RepID=A0A821U856_9NEOP|nr:unnamed protein product [Pieris macdunnoughi]
MSFKSKVVIVTGSSAGIGAALAIAFSREGADVVITGRNRERLEKVAEECKVNRSPLIIQADLTNDHDVEEIVNKTIEKHGKIDILVNNAGIVQLSSLADDTFLNAFDHVVKINLRAVIKMTNSVTPHIIASKGNIINISSVSGRQLYAYQYTVYGMLKASLDYFTQGAALELGKYGVRVNAVSPGPVETDIKPILVQGMRDQHFQLYFSVTVHQRR